MRVLNPLDLLEVPRLVAVCPCGNSLVANLTGWKLLPDDSGYYLVELELNCASEPSVDSDDWEDWLEDHNIILLYFCDTVINWINQNYRIVPENQLTLF